MRPLEAFYKDSRTPLGVMAYCKLCHRKIVRRYERTLSPEKKERARILGLARSKKRRKRLTAQQRRRNYLYLKSWRSRHLAKAREIDTRMKRLRRKFGRIDEDTRQEVLSIGFCAYCGRDDVKLIVDHIVPLFKGGDHSLENLAPACIPCNSSKSNRPVVEMLSDLPERAEVWWRAHPRYAPHVDGAQPVQERITHTEPEHTDVLRTTG